MFQQYVLFLMSHYHPLMSFSLRIIGVKPPSFTAPAHTPILRKTPDSKRRSAHTLKRLKRLALSGQHLSSPKCAAGAKQRYTPGKVCNPAYHIQGLLFSSPKTDFRVRK